MKPELVIAPDTAEAAAERFLALRPRTLALAGGATPRRLYQRLATCALPWSATEVFFSDERCVPPDHRDSNFRMADEALLSKVPANVHRMRGETCDAAAYEEELGRVFGPGLPEFDLVLLGLGEHRSGAGRGTSDMLYMTSSTGVGAGVIIGGRLLHGQRSIAEAGHMIIERSSGSTVESLGSGTALGTLAGAEGATVTGQAKAGDKRALAVFREIADAFATGVYNLVHCFMPQRVVIGGGVSQAGELLLEPIRERLGRCAGCSASATDVVLARGGDDVGLLGAFALWMDSLADGTAGRRLTPARPSA